MKLFWRSIVFLAIASFSPLAFGQVTIWNNTGDSTWETTTNWNNGLPSGANATYILPGASSSTTTPGFYTVGGSAAIVINATSNQSASNLYVGNVTDTFGNHAVIGSVSINFSSGNALTISSGSNIVVSNSTLNFAGNLNLQTSAEIILGATSQYIPTTPSSNPGPGTMNYTSGNLSGAQAYLELGTIASGLPGYFNQSGNSNVDIGALDIGTVTAGNGTYTLTSSGTLTAENYIYTGTGTFIQNNSASTALVNALYMGANSGDVSLYQLQAGTLYVGDSYIGDVTGATATLSQTSGALISYGTFEVGTYGTGNYNLNGGTADFQGGIDIGGMTSTGVGVFTQSGGTLTAEDVVYVGGDVGNGAGTYKMQGGTATLSSGMFIGATGNVIQSGGTMIIPSGQDLDLSTSGAQYNLNGGTLQIADGSLIGSTGEGLLNFGGGTLQIMNAGTFTDSLDGTLSSVSTIDGSTTAGVTTVTLGGTLSGSGGLDFVGSAGTTFQFGGTTSYTGSTEIYSGILDATDVQIQNSSAWIIGATGTLNLSLTSSGTFDYTGNLSGSGTLNVDYNVTGQTFGILGTNNNFTGSIVLGANGTQGVLQLDNGTFGNISDNGTNSDVNIGNGVGSGVVTLLGNNTYTGTTTVTNGYTLNASTFNGDVDISGTFGPTGTLAAYGTLNSLGSQTNITNVTFNSGSLYSNGVIGVYTNGTTATLYNITSGSASLTGTVDVIGAGTGTFTIVNANSVSIGGNHQLNVAGGLTTNPATILFSSTLLQQSAGTLSVATIQNSLAGFATTPNQLSVAQVLDPLTQTPPSGFVPLLTSFNQLTSSSQVAAGLEQLTPESLQYSRNIAFENATFLSQRVNGFLNDLRNGYGGLDTNGISVSTPGFTSGLGRSMASMLAYNDPPFHDSAPNGVNYYPGGSGLLSSPSDTPSSSSSRTSTGPASPTTSDSQTISDSPVPMRNSQPPNIRTSNFSEFVGGDVVLADLNQNPNMPSKATYTAGDVTAGVAFRMTSNLSVGVLFDYNHTNAKTDSNGSTTTANSYTPGIFATYYDQNFYVNGLFAFGYNTYSNSRAIPIAGETATSNPNGQQYITNLDFGYNLYIKQASMVVTPTLGITYTHLNVDSFSESGAPVAGLNVNSQDVNSVRTRLGGHVMYETKVGNLLLQPNVSAMWQHEYLDNEPGITSQFQGFSASPFTIQTASPSENSALVGCGLTAVLDNSMAFYLNYFADVGGNGYLSQSIMGGFKASF